MALESLLSAGVTKKGGTEMLVHQVFAMVLDQEVKNIMVCDNYELANELARVMYGEAAIAVDCLQYPCSPKDQYINGEFYYKDSGVKVERRPTEDERISELEAQLLDSLEAIAELYTGGE